MPRHTAMIFGTLGVLRIECAKCGRSGRYHISKLVEQRGQHAKLFEWSDELTADCPRKRAKRE